MNGDVSKPPPRSRGGATGRRRQGGPWRRGNGAVTLIEELEPGLVTYLRALTPAEAPDRIALHLSRVVELALASSSDSDRVEIGARVAERLVEAVRAEVHNPGSEGERLADPARVLAAILTRNPDGTPHGSMRRSAAVRLCRDGAPVETSPSPQRDTPPERAGDAAAAVS